MKRFQQLKNKIERFQKSGTKEVTLSVAELSAAIAEANSEECHGLKKENTVLRHQINKILDELEQYKNRNISVDGGTF